MSYKLQIQWGCEFVDLPGTFETQEAAEWAAACWRQQQQCRGDPFAVELSPEPPPARPPVDREALFRYVRGLHRDLQEYSTETRRELPPLAKLSDTALMRLSASLYERLRELERHHAG